uniref:Inactive rhomboid protein n=1 Tax=Astyanax mexicanus TaxID=7994 RepID=A0A8B9HCF4_ASTMX
IHSLWYRQGFLRSVSMPVETSHLASPPRDLFDPRRPPLQRQASITQTIKRGTADWFGVSKDGDATQKWQRKSLRHCSMRYGKLKPQVIREMELPSQDNISLTSTETPPPLYVPSSQHGIPKVRTEIPAPYTHNVMLSPSKPIVVSVESVPLCSYAIGTKVLGHLHVTSTGAFSMMSYSKAKVIVSVESVPLCSYTASKSKNTGDTWFLCECERVVRFRLNDCESTPPCRPFFTYWITFVHLLITILAVCIYGIAPVGFSQHETVDSVLRNKGVYENVKFVQQENFWIGPSSEALIHLGAKFSPCMRRDQEVHDLIQKKRETERNSACCVRNDRSGCLQTSEEECSVRSSQSHSIKLNHIRLTCLEPASVAPHEWPDDITKWPICTRYDTGNHTNLPHIDCTITGRPCCIGTKGRCEITSREYCDFMKGYFHEEATLCSQVHCMDDVCGLLPFLNPEIPDQFYRLWLSLFLHAGILHCLVSVLFQMTILRDLEKLAGWLRISIIYILSGITGNLASAIFLPYRAEVGPAGSQFGILACLFVELFQSWQILAQPWRAFTKLLCVVLFLFSFGLLPWIDNFAHICGFISGFFLSFAFLPYISFGRMDMYRKRCQILVFLAVFLGLFAGLVVLFYVYPIKCEWCELLTCIPLTDKFCEKYDLNAHLH